MALFWNTFFFPFKTVIAIAASIILVRWLNIEAYALLAIATSVQATLGLYSDLGIERSLAKFVPEIELNYGRTGVKRFVLGMAGLKLSLLAVLVIILNIFGDYFSNLFKMGDQGALLIPIISALLILGCISDVTINVLYAFFKQKITNLLDILVAVVNPVLQVTFVLIGWGPVGVLMALLVTTVLSVIVSTFQAIRAARQSEYKDREIHRDEAKGLLKRVFSYAGLTYFLSISVYFYDLPFVVFILTAYQDLVAVALITLAYKFAKQFLRVLVVPLTGVQTPLFSRVYAEGRWDAMRTAYATLTKFLIFALIPAGAGLAIISGDVMQILYMKNEAGAVLNLQGLPETVTATIILIGFLFGESVISVALSALMVYEHHVMVIVSRIIALAAIPMLIILAPTYGVIGAAVAMGVPPFLSRVVSLVFAKKALDVKFPWRFLGKVSAASAVFVAVLVPLVNMLPTTIPVVIGLVALAVALFYVSFRVFGGFDKSDKERLTNLKVPFSKLVVRYL